MIKYIREHVPLEELLAQLAEEATELAHAALKVRRAYSDTNPTPTPSAQAWEDLTEEIADVELLLQVLDMDRPTPKRLTIRHAKLERWVGRIEDRIEKEAEK
jgi:NTP pyrophosphatase (non-canonical NTP hydrolase)